MQDGSLTDHGAAFAEAMRLLTETEGPVSFENKPDMARAMRTEGVLQENARRGPNRRTRRVLQFARARRN